MVGTGSHWDSPNSTGFLLNSSSFGKTRRIWLKLSSCQSRLHFQPHPLPSIRRPAKGGGCPPYSVPTPKFSHISGWEKSYPITLGRAGINLLENEEKSPGEVKFAEISVRFPAAFPQLAQPFPNWSKMGSLGNLGGNRDRET